MDLPAKAKDKIINAIFQGMTDANGRFGGNTKLKGKYRKGGLFIIDLPTGRKAKVIVSGEHRGHASVSTGDLLPIWAEMEFIKQEVFGDDEVYQIHPKKAEYVNIDEVLHLWGDTDNGE